MLLLPIAFVLAQTATSTSLAQRASINQPKAILEALIEEFDPLVMPHFFQIADCESGDPKVSGSARQFNRDGTVVSHLNKDGTTDYGVMEINSSHEEEAAKLELDFKNSIVDNIKMAKRIYLTQGFGAWSTCSKRLGLI